MKTIMFEIANAMYLITILAGGVAITLLAMFLLGMIDTAQPEAFILMLIALVVIPLGMGRALQGWTANAYRDR